MRNSRHMSRPSGTVGMCCLPICRSIQEHRQPTTLVLPELKLAPGHGAGCENAVESSADLGAAPLDVACKCGGTFCFQCKEEAHRPVCAQLLISHLCRKLVLSC